MTPAERTGMPNIHRDGQRIQVTSVATGSTWAAQGGITRATFARGFPRHRGASAPLLKFIMPLFVCGIVKVSYIGEVPL